MITNFLSHIEQEFNGTKINIDRDKFSLKNDLVTIIMKKENGIWSETIFVANVHDYNKINARKIHRETVSKVKDEMRTLAKVFKYFIA